MVVLMFLQLVANDFGGPEDLPLTRLNRCGPIALWVTTKSIGRPLKIADIESAGPKEDQKWTFADLQSAAHDFGFQTSCRKFSKQPVAFAKGEAAAIARIFLRDGESHYVTFIESRGNVVVVDDFPRERGLISVEMLRLKFGWDGSLLFIFEDPSIGVRLNRENELRTAYFAAAILFFFAAGIVGFLRRRTLSGSLIHRFQPMKDKNSRSGFTMVELLVSIGIVAALMALVLPAILNSRDRANAASCGNNLHQIGLAVSGFESAHDCYPNPRQLPRAASEIPPQNRAIFSPHVGLLPWLDLANVDGQIDYRNDIQSQGDPVSSTANGGLLMTSISVFRCPADSVPAGGNSYRACTGTSPGLYTTPQIAGMAASLIGWHSGAKTSSRDVTDGLSNTVFFAERTVGDLRPQSFTPFRDVALNASGNLLSPEQAVVACNLITAADPRHASFVGSTWLYFGYMETAYNHVLEPNARIIDCTSSSLPDMLPPGAHTSRSLHHGGVNVMMGDASVRFISSSIDRKVWRSLGSIQGQEQLSEF
jgi:prepilin-type N-terminal cleavage/methylation domain-containing protein